MSFIQKITGGYASSAKVVDGTLILSLPDAATPVVWQMDLAQVKSSALEIQEKESGGYVLTLKNAKGESNDIAPFSSRAAALKALMAASAAMESAHGQIKPLAATAGSGMETLAVAPSGKRSNMVAGLIGVVLLVALIAALINMGPRMSGLSSDLTASGLSPAAGEVDASGVPVSADDFLRSR